MNTIFLLYIGTDSAANASGAFPLYSAPVTPRFLVRRRSAPACPDVVRCGVLSDGRRHSKSFRMNIIFSLDIEGAEAAGYLRESCIFVLFYSRGTKIGCSPALGASISRCGSVRRAV